MFLISFRNILRPQQMFPRLLAQENIMSKNVSATMCTRLPPPLVVKQNNKNLYYKMNSTNNPQIATIRSVVTWKKSRRDFCVIVLYRRACFVAFLRTQGGSRVTFGNNRACFEICDWFKILLRLCSEQYEQTIYSRQSRSIQDQN